MALSVNLVIIGDSVLSAHDGTSFPDELVARLSGVADITLTNFAVPGQTLEQQMALYASQAGAAFDNASFDRNICVIHHGSNDLLSDISLSEWQDLAQDLVDDLVATGYEVVTVEAYQWAFDAFSGYVFNTESDWEDYNSTVNSLSGISAVINTSAIPELTNQANVDNPPYYIDQEHLSAEGAELWAEFAAPIVSDLIGPELMALSRTNISSTKVEGAGGNSITSGSFTPPNNSLLVAVFGAVNAPLAGTPTVSGGSLTWTRRINLGPNYFGGSPPEYHLITEVWTAPVTTGSSMTVTASGNGSTPLDGYKILQLFAYTGYDVASPIGASVTRNNAADTGALSLTLSGAPAATSEVIAGRGRFDNNVYNTTATPGSGWTELYDDQTSGGFNDLETQARTGSTSTTVAWVDIDDVGGSSSVAVHSFAIEIKAAAGGGGITISADAGSYAINGTAAGVKRGRKVGAAAGSYALTGTAATVRIGRKVVAAAGSYSITGTAATIRHAWRVTAAAGSYSITGTAATIRKNKPLVAAAGSYSIAGTAATVRKGKVLAAASGSYAITGTAATLRLARKLIAAAGSYSLTGTDAALTIAAGNNKLLSAAAGSYSLTGTAATVRHGWKTAAAAGSYAITGAAATVRHGWKVVAAAGSYAITGTAATVRHGWKIAAAAGSYVLTGTAANVTKISTKTVIADPGSYAITGTAATFKSARRVIAASGSYAITGTAANVSRGRRVIAGGGVYSLTGQDASIIKGQRRVSAESGSYVLTGSAASLVYFTPDGPRTDPTSRSVSRNVSTASRPSAISSTRPAARTERRRNVA